MIVESFQQEVVAHGDKCRIVPAGRLKDLRQDIEDFRNNGHLNGFQKYIVNNMYQFDLPSCGFEVRSIVVIASPVPSYANVVFNWQNRKIPVIGLARSYDGKADAATATKQCLTGLLESTGYHLSEAPQLPLKRLAVRSGLAAYGRNNICFVDGMGSFLTLVAYLSNLEPVDDNWYSIRQIDSCANCTACLSNCPTGAILKDRFLINNERCLSYFNESSDDFPEWLPKSVHHCLYDCLMCQNICPANKEYINNVVGPVEFDERETNLLLSGEPMAKFPPDLEHKAKFLGMDRWIDAIPRNLKILLENGTPMV